MHQIKQLPEDFIVKEISKASTEENGFYAYFLLKKTNYSTVKALEIIAGRLKIPLKKIGFAGNKDKNAVTEQKISVYMGNKNIENIEFKGIKLEYLGNGKKPISLGDLEGNEFVITLRNLEDDEINKIKQFEKRRINVPNLFGPQRFGNNNNLVGKAIIKKDFKKAVELILENIGSVEKKIKSYLEGNKNDYIGALRLMTLKTRKIFTHSYQSLIFNKIVNEYLSNMHSDIDNNNSRALRYNEIKNMELPIIGFNFDLDNTKDAKLKAIIRKILEEEKITPRDFITGQMPELASEGTSRKLFFELNDLEVLEIGKDELNKGCRKIKMSFSLPKSCYATTAIEFILKSGK